MELTKSYQLIAETIYTVQGTNSLRLYGKYNSQDISTNKSNITLQLSTMFIQKNRFTFNGGLSGSIEGVE